MSWIAREQERPGHDWTALGGQLEVHEALLQHLAAAVGARQRRRAGRALQAYGAMAQRLEGVQVAPGPAAEI